MDILSVLRRSGPLQAGALATSLGISRATLSRQVKQAEQGLITLGQARRTAYAARRPVGGTPCR
jgi:DNA-binding Lrp family transcriptional regulator